MTHNEMVHGLCTQETITVQDFAELMVYQSDKDVQLSRLRWHRQGTYSCAEHLPSLYAV